MANINMLPVDCLIEVFKRTGYNELLAFRQTEHLIDLVDDELRRRVLLMRPNWFKSAQLLCQYLQQIQPFAHNMKIDFNFYDRKFADYNALMFEFLHRCPTIRNLTLENVCLWTMSNTIRVFGQYDFARVRTLNILGQKSSTDERVPSTQLAGMLRSCAPGVLRDLHLSECLATGANLQNIPGQLDRLQLSGIHSKSMQWGHLYNYLERYPLVQELQIDNDNCQQPINLTALAPHLLHATSLKIHNNRGAGIENWAALAQLVNLRHLNIQSDGQQVFSFLAGLTERHQLTHMRWEVSNFEFPQYDMPPLEQLKNLQSLEVIVRGKTRGIKYLLRTIQRMPWMRTFALYSIYGNRDCSSHTMSQYLPDEETLVSNLQHIKHLQIEINRPFALRRLNDLPHLRSLQLRIEVPVLATATNLRKFNAHFNGFLRTLGRARRLRKLHLVTRGARMAVDSRCIHEGFGGGTPLQTLVLDMWPNEHAQYREAAKYVRSYEEVFDEDNEWWDEDTVEIVPTLAEPNTRL